MSPQKNENESLSIRITSPWTLGIWSLFSLVPFSVHMYALLGIVDPCGSECSSMPGYQGSSLALLLPSVYPWEVQPCATVALSVQWG